ncbi:MAG: hypothetical protein AAF492_12085, partial [Verrucomicrobiota bacterium]
RGQMNEFETTLGGGNLAMDDDQRGRMMEIFDESEGLDRDMGGFFWRSGDKSQEEVDAEVEEYVADLETGYNQMAEDASEVLNEDQMDAFTIHLNNKLQMQTSRARMGARFRNNMSGMFRGNQGGVGVAIDVQTE